ncbi:transposase [Methylocystis sp. WRRC1]|uniref:transposase n=1 Tax=Methylocystis sp. WRRC1 TaxID=1732014 RepID=UPI001D14D5DA|nr:transposase [Methylocystis sp. WRRC1]MCC3246893.1 transposase [Methylocystis sp. WRRC1]
MAEENYCGSAVGERRRRYWKKEEKRRIVAESFKDGASVAEVARRYDLNANLLFTWLCLPQIQSD